MKRIILSSLLLLSTLSKADRNDCELTTSSADQLLASTIAEAKKINIVVINTIIIVDNFRNHCD